MLIGVRGRFFVSIILVELVSNMLFLVKSNKNGANRGLYNNLIRIDPCYPEALRAISDISFSLGTVTDEKHGNI